MLSHRAQRAIALIAAALAVIVVGGLLYLRPTLQSKPRIIAAAPLPQLDGHFSPDFFFVTPSLGWAAIAETDGPRIWVYRTTDGSRHWQKQLALSDTSSGTPTIRFFDASHGYLFDGRLYRTQDAGVHWDTISLPDATRDFDLASPTEGWAVDTWSTPQSLYATTDGGLTWRRAGELPSPLYGKGLGGYEFRSGGEGWAGGASASPIVYATFDGGVSWRIVTVPSMTPPSPIPSPVPVGKGFGYPLTYQTAVLLLPHKGLVVDEYDAYGRESLYVTFDRGATWRAVSAPPAKFGFESISFIDSQHWWASRLGLLAETSDAGRTWRLVNTVFELDGEWTIDTAHVIDTRHGWLQLTSQAPPGARNRVSMLLMSSDAGVHWKPVNVPSPA